MSTSVSISAAPSIGSEIAGRRGLPCVGQALRARRVAGVLPRWLDGPRAHPATSENALGQEALDDSMTER